MVSPTSSIRDALAALMLVEMRAGDTSKLHDRVTVALMRSARGTGSVRAVMIAASKDMTVGEVAAQLTPDQAQALSESLLEDVRDVVAGRGEKVSTKIVRLVFKAFGKEISFMQAFLWGADITWRDARADTAP